ncbi:oxidoreductase [Endozoicomonas sp. OPT23]|uniref:Gfo/Idh/MocA family protein n=1 Tax=Endozoicomonas sp. OPT23 TaxID=2072845 RepID=UPI00129B61EE|nr:Gfo/Idh/MocA family oxidoreductase [Endozoicomonas sp. OPT23]MRI33450.1 oxidoreductase [Endozoicomonas sp. OPT23]
MIRIGILGAARIAPMALIEPAKKLAGVEVTAIAARDPEKARAFAKKHEIPVVCDSYDELIAREDIDAIYNPLPNSLHAEWSIKALKAGKDVLCEKPFANNEQDAKAMVEAANASTQVLMEAFHYRYHPLIQRVKELVPTLGKIKHIHTSMCFPLPMFNDIRYNYALGGGATMDVGAYTTNLLRLVAKASGDPDLAALPDVDQAKASLKGAEIDRHMETHLSWPNGTTARTSNSLWSWKLVSLKLEVEGENGKLYIKNPYLPQLFHKLVVFNSKGKTLEKLKAESTYFYQLEEFCRRINERDFSPESHQDSIENMRLIDSIYRAAGLKLRGQE